MIQQLKAWLNGKPTLGKNKKATVLVVRCVYTTVDVEFVVELADEAARDQAKLRLSQWWWHGVTQTHQLAGLHISRNGLQALHVR